MSEAPSESLSAPPPRRLLPAAIFILSFAAFLPALKGDFVDWDDDVLFLKNTDYRGLGPVQINWMFTHAILGHYQPITWITHGLDFCLWGMNPFGYHLTSLIFHALCAVLVYLFANRILQLARFTDRGSAGVDDESALRITAALAALLFALHPLRVESVAWITERRDLVCTFFLIPSILCYLRYAVGSGDPLFWYIAAIILFALSLLSKAWGITLPVVLLVLDVYPLRRLRLHPRGLLSLPNRTALLDKLPFAFLAFFAAKMAVSVQSFAGMESLAAHSPLQRLAQACYGLVFYLAKSLLPIRLNPIYELPLPFDPFAPRFLLAAVLLIILVVSAFLLRRRLPAITVAFVVYAVILSPVLGLAQSGRQLVADRYSYLACIPWAIVAAAAWMAFVRKRNGARGRLAALPVAILLLMAVLTWRQCAVWRNSTTLWEHAVTLDPDSCSARNSLGFLLARQRRFDEAAALFQACLDRNPDDPLVLMNLAAAKKELKQNAAALRLLRRALDLRPKNSDSVVMIAEAFSELGDDRQSLEAARLAIEESPDDARGPYAAGQALTRLGDVAAASPYLQKAVELLEPQFPPGSIDPHRDVNAAMYTTACAILSDYFEKKRDYDQAALYRDKGLRSRGL